MATTQPLLVFCVGEGRYALAAHEVERVVFAAELTPLPDAPAHVLGLLNIAGEIMPVIDLRVRFGLPPRGMSVSDRLVVTRAGGTPAALLVEAVEGVFERPVQPAADAPATVAGTAEAGGKLVELCRAEALISPPGGAQRQDERTSPHA